MNQRKNQELQVNEVCFDQGFGEQHKSAGIVSERFAPDDLPGMAH